MNQKIYDWKLLDDEKLLGDFDTEQDFKYFRSYHVTSFGERSLHRAKLFFEGPNFIFE